MTSPIQIDAHTAQALSALLSSVAFAPLTSLGWIRVTGSDRVRWLNGMVTNSIHALQPGDGCYNFVLNAQGRIQADLTAWMLQDSILLQTASPTNLVTILDRFIIMDDVELEVLRTGSCDGSSFAQDSPARNSSEIPLNPVTLAGILVAGPQALSIVAALGTSGNHAAPCSPGSSETSETSQPASPDALSLKQTAYAGARVTLLRAHSPLIPRFEIWSDPSTIAHILNELKDTHVSAASNSDLDALRILEGTPVYGTDIRDKDLPQETAQIRALHFAKGCYLGQEIVERIRSRGNVHRTFSGFVLTGDLPASGTPLTSAEAPEKPIGELTSVSAIDLSSGPIQLGLGYIRREVLERDLPLHYPGGTAQPVTLPFSAAQAQTSAPQDSASD